MNASNNKRAAGERAGVSPEFGCRVSGVGCRFARSVVFVAFILAASGSTAFALDLDPTRALWGFDGRVAPGRFNLLSVPVTNPTGRPFDGVLRLERLSLGGRVGAAIEQPLFLGPNSTAPRWVQFTPYVVDGEEDWVLSWEGTSRGRAGVDAPNVVKRTERIRVLLVDPDRFGGRIAAVRAFPDDLFPTSVTGTAGLDAVVLDHAPRWQAGRRRAFLDWLFLGGRIVMLKGEDGTVPGFPPEMNELNNPAADFRFGAGRVLRLDKPRGALTPADLAASAATRASDAESETSAKPGAIDNIAATEGAAQNGSEGEDEAAVGAGDAKPQPGNAPYGYDYGPKWIENASNGFFAELRQMTRPDHNWPLIYLMAFVYILLIFPGFWLLARRRFDYRVIYGAFIGTVAVFSVGFSFVGRRGYGEATAAYSVSIARPLPDGALDATSWTNAFLTRGYSEWTSITHKGKGLVYTSGQNTEPVRGRIINGAGGRIETDIPPYSSRTFQHRMKLDAGGFDVSIKEWQAEGQLGCPVLTVGPDFPSSEDVYAMHVLAGDRMYEVRRNEITLRAPPAAGAALTNFFNEIEFENYGEFPAQADFFGFEEKKSIKARFQDLHRPLIGSTLNVEKWEELEQFKLPPGRARLYVYAESPESFALESDRIQTAHGRVLYVVELESDSVAEPRP